jgi:hypothetical protein
MPAPSPAIVHVLDVFAVAFTRPTFDHAVTLIAGTLLTSGRRTVTAALRAIGLRDERHFTTYHRVLNRAVWSPLVLSHLLLTLLLTTLVAADEPLVVAFDDTLERRYGRCVAHKGCYHDAVRSRPGHPMTTTGICWLCCAALVRLPWSSRSWALPFLTIPAPAPSVSATLGKPHRTLPEQAVSLVRVLRRSAWYAKEEATFVDLVAAVRREIWHTWVMNRPTRAPTPQLANSPEHSDPALAALLQAACYAA